MLLALAQWLQNDASFLRVIGYLTFRAVMASITALVIGLVCGPWVIRKLTSMKVGQAVRTDGPQTHLVKSGTPTMGGVLILLGIAVSTLLWADLTNRFIWIVILVTFGFGVIGWVDDYRKVVYKDPRGMSSREKYFWQSVIGLFAAVYLAFSVSEANNVRVFDLFMAWVRSGLSMGLPARADLMLPFLKSITYPLGVWGFIALTYFVIVGASNAVNLTDGLDGLAISVFAVSAAAFTALAYVSTHVVFAEYLQLVKLNSAAAELTIFCGALVGASLGFLWWNSYPADIFMGDVGSLGLGGALGTVALAIKQEMLLPLVGGVFVLEALSVIIQVASFKLTGKRVFKMAPLHHHFELIGWSEPKVITRFLIAAIIFALFALTTLKLR